MAFLTGLVQGAGGAALKAGTAIKSGLEKGYQGPPLDLTGGQRAQDSAGAAPMMAPMSSTPAPYDNPFAGQMPQAPPAPAVPSRRPGTMTTQDFIQFLLQQGG